MSDLAENRSHGRRRLQPSGLKGLSPIHPAGNRAAAFTSGEVLMSLAVTGFICGGILAGYIQSARGAAHSTQSRAALGMAIEPATEAWSAELESRVRWE